MKFGLSGVDVGWHGPLLLCNLNGQFDHSGNSPFVNLLLFRFRYSLIKELDQFSDYRRRHSKLAVLQVLLDALSYLLDDGQIKLASTNLRTKNVFVTLSD